MRTSFTGLTDQEVKASRQQHGTNTITPPKKESLWKLFAGKFNDPIIRILLIAALLSFIVSFVHRDFSETLGIFFAILLATVVGFWFEVDANKKFELLNQVNNDTPVKVIRNGHIYEIPKIEIVVGDVVLLETGEEVPADGELMETVSLQINESTLTGELVVDKTTNEKEMDEEATYPSNRVCRGTTVIDGHCTMEVFAVGDATEFGKVAKESTSITGEITPLNKQLDSLAKIISIVGFSLGLLTFTVLFLKDILFGQSHYTSKQLILLVTVLISFGIMLSKIWLPIAHDGLNLIWKKKKKQPEWIENNSWFVWVGLGAVVFILLCGICYLGSAEKLSRPIYI